MEGITNKHTIPWIRPWMAEQFDDLYNRDERFFSIVLKGCLGWLTKNIILYNKPIQHFIFNTGSAYMFVESNGYEFSWTETSGEDQLYMSMPRCVVEIGNIDIDTSELTNPFTRVTYERRNGNNIEGFNGECRRLPLNISLTCRYVLSNFNESIVLLQELIDTLIFQKYFNIAYLGQQIQCSIEFPQSQQIEINKIDMTSPETNQKTINIELKLCTSYPIINERTEISNNAVIASFGNNLNVYNSDMNGYKTQDKIHKEIY